MSVRVSRCLNTWGHSDADGDAIWIGRYDEEGVEGTDSTVYSTAVALAIMGCFQTVVAVIGIFAADKVCHHREPSCQVQYTARYVRRSFTGYCEMR